MECFWNLNAVPRSMGLPNTSKVLLCLPIVITKLGKSNVELRISDLVVLIPRHMTLRFSAVGFPTPAAWAWPRDSLHPKGS
jgi:hypothetical protein